MRNTNTIAVVDTKKKTSGEANNTIAGLAETIVTCIGGQKRIELRSLNLPLKILSTRGQGEFFVASNFDPEPVLLHYRKRSHLRMIRSLSTISNN